MKLVFLALIPLILSIGITPALSFDFIPEADALKSKGNSLTETGSKKFVEIDYVQKLRHQNNLQW